MAELNEKELEELSESFRKVLEVGSPGFCLALLLLFGCGERDSMANAIGRAIGSFDEALQKIGERIKQDKALLACFNDWGINLFNEDGQIKTLEEIAKQIGEAFSNEHCTD